MRYRVDPPEMMRVVELDAMTAIYHRRAGVTHLVAEPVPAILAELARGEASLSELAIRLGAEHEQDALAERLEELRLIGLVKTA